MWLGTPGVQFCACIFLNVYNAIRPKQLEILGAKLSGKNGFVQYAFTRRIVSCFEGLHGESVRTQNTNFAMFHKRYKRVANCFPVVLICIHSICFLRICLRTGFVPKMWMFPWFSNPQLWFKNSTHVVEENNVASECPRK